MSRRRIIRVLVVAAIALGVWAFLNRSGSGPDIPSGSTLVLTMQGEYTESMAPSVIMRFLGEDSKPFAGLLSTLAIAQRDDRIDTVIFHIRDLGIGWGKAYELREAIAELRNSGRKTIAYFELASFSAGLEYYVASAADEIYFMPGSTIPIVGLAAEYLYFGGALEKAGIAVEVAKVGKYKSATETISGTEMSDPAREMVDSLLDSVLDEFVRAVAEGRGLSPQEVRGAIDSGPVLAAELESLKLIDGVLHLDELPEMEGSVVKGDVYASVDPSQVGFAPVAHFALVYGAGNVVTGRGSVSRRGQTVMASETVGDALTDAAADPNIDAIIFRIDSPGGSALASEAIWSALERAKRHGKPIIASFSDTAASGGYYAAAGADAIVADPGTLTGSIGVFTLRPVLAGLLDDLGINVESITRGRHADFLLSSQPMSDASKERLQRTVNEFYRLFLERVADGRGMETGAVDQVAQGRVWTGEQALEQGLVDELGGLRAAVLRGKRAIDLAEDADVALVPYPSPVGLAQELRDWLDGKATARVAALVRESLIADLPLPAAVREIVEWCAEFPLDVPLAAPSLFVEIR